MNSSLKIALGLGNEPVIHFNIIPSDDIRDQLCCQFLHKLGGASTTCSVSIEATLGSNGNKDYHLLQISPIPPILEGLGSYTDQLEFITTLRAIEHTIREQKNLGWTSMCVGGDIVYWENNQTVPCKLSKQYSRRELSMLHRDELVRKIIEILEGVDKWESTPGPDKNIK